MFIVDAEDRLRFRDVGVARRRQDGVVIESGLDAGDRVIVSPLEVVVIDNHSTDDSVKVLRRDFPDFRVIENPENYGVARGRNIGIDYALKNGAESVLILDNDTIVDKHFLSELVQVFYTDPLVGIVGPLIYYYEQPDLIQ